MATNLLPASGDIAVTLSTDPNNPSGVMVEVPLDPSGDIGLVVNMARIEQDVILRLSIPEGTSPFYPDKGNRLFSQIGRPFQDPMELTDSIADVESQLLAEHQQDAQDGQRASSATLKRIIPEAPQVVGTQVVLRVTVQAEDDTESLITAGG